jgi:hypothetical protein
MRSKLFGLGFTFFIIATTAHSQQIELPDIAFFLTTSPINADVLLDGKPLEEQTPLLLRQLGPGRHELEIRKQGYRTELREIELEPGEILSLEIDLASLSFRPVLPEEETVTIRGEEEEAGDTVYRLPEGSYSFNREGGSLHIEPVFPQDSWIRGLNLAIPLSVAFTAVLTLHDVFYPKRAALQFTEDFSLSPATLSAYGLTFTLISFDIALYVTVPRSTTNERRICWPWGSWKRRCASTPGSWKATKTPPCIHTRCSRRPGSTS